MHLPSVLIIDDSELERYMLVHQLKRIGIESLIEKSDATSGLEYLQSYAQNTLDYGKIPAPELIILDVNMPGMDGFEFLQKCAELQRKGELTQCQILMYTGSDDEEEHNKALQYNFVKGILIKGELEVEQLKVQIEALNFIHDAIED